MNITSQSLLELIFKNGDWDGLYIDNSERDLRRKLLPFFDRKVIEKWDSSSESAEEFYGLMTQLLKTDSNDRFLLYCPIEIIPDLSKHGLLNQNMRDFLVAYLNSWFRTLNFIDIRANFIDGDIPDVELSDRHTDKIIQSSFIAEDLLKKKILSSRYFDGLFSHRGFDVSFRDLVKRKIKHFQFVSVNYDNFNTYVAEFLDSALVFFNDIKGISHKRIEWLKSESRAFRINEIAQNVNLDLIQDYDDLSDDAIDVVVNAISYQFRRNNNIIYDHLGRLISWKDRDSVRFLICKLYNYNNSYDYLNHFGYECPDFCINQKVDHLPFDFFALNKISDLIYPAAILYGSRIKGYSGIKSDHDIAVVLRDSVSDHDYSKIDLAFGQKVLKFKTSTDYSRVSIIDHNRHDPLSGSCDDSHVLFNGVWVGDDQCIRFLYTNMLKHLNLSGDSFRAPLERDLLQYRLLHRGYERFNFVDKPTFFDIGYRCVASRLFLSKIFDVNSRL